MVWIEQTLFFSGSSSRLTLQLNVVTRYLLYWIGSSAIVYIVYCQIAHETKDQASRAVEEISVLELRAQGD